MARAMGAKKAMTTAQEPERKYLCPYCNTEKKCRDRINFFIGNTAQSLCGVAIILHKDDSSIDPPSICRKRCFV